MARYTYMELSFSGKVYGICIWHRFVSLALSVCFRHRWVEKGLLEGRLGPGSGQVNKLGLTSEI